MTITPIQKAKKYILAEQFKKAKQILKPLAEGNNAEAQLILGYLYYGGDYNTTAETAKYWLEKSSLNGNAEAMMYVATSNFQEGQNSSEAIDSDSFSLLLKAAEKGSAEAQRSLAIMYAHGEIVPKDYHQTMYWDEKAASQGLVESQHDLAVMLLLGENGTVDIPQAIFWFEQAASEEHNVPHAQWAAEILASIYSGESDPEYTDKEKSEFWLKRANYLETAKPKPHPDWFYNDL